MSDAEVAHPAGVRGDVSSSFASVWRNYAGERPADIETQIKGTHVTCVLKGASRQFDEGMAAAAADHDGESRKLTAATFRSDAIHAVTRATRRKVMAFVSKHDAKTDVATELFILELPPRA